MKYDSTVTIAENVMANIGFHPDRVAHQKLTPADYAASGALSSCATRATCQPLDVLKIRLQLQVENKSNAKYRSMFHAVATMLKEEGVTSFWKGHLPAQYLSVVYGVCQFSSFESLTKVAFTVAPWSTDSHFRPVFHFVFGGVAGVAGTLVSYPFDVVRTRLVAQGGRDNQLYSGTIDAVRKMKANEGYRSFFRGIVPSFATIAPYSGLQFGFYTLFTQLLSPLITK